jgi:hypothetical protein
MLDNVVIGAEFMRSYSRNFQLFMEPGRFINVFTRVFTGPYPEIHESSPYPTLFL